MESKPVGSIPLWFCFSSCLQVASWVSALTSLNGGLRYGSATKQILSSSDGFSSVSYPSKREATWDLWAEPGLPLILTTLRVFFLMLVFVYRTLELHSTQKTREKRKEKGTEENSQGRDPEMTVKKECEGKTNTLKIFWKYSKAKV